MGAGCTTEMFSVKTTTFRFDGYIVIVSVSATGLRS